MMTSSSPVRQFDLETVRSPTGSDARPVLRGGIAASVGLAVGAAFLLVMPGVPGLVRSAWCAAETGPACDPGSQLTGQLVDTVIWAIVLLATATAVSAPLAWLAGAISGVRLTMPLVLLGPPLVWALMVLGEPFGVALHRLRSPWVLAQAALAYLLAGLLTGHRPRPLWRLLGAAAIVTGTAAAIAFGYPFN
ncbi:MAG TPA: hypothetical protein VGL06_21085 [Pseudonocardiaceae bacterium]